MICNKYLRADDESSNCKSCEGEWEKKKEELQEVSVFWFTFGFSSAAATTAALKQPRQNPKIPLNSLLPKN